MSLFIASGTMAQNAPITTAATVGGAVPGTVTVPITVINFSNIGAISLSIDYNYSVMHFVQGTPNSQLSSFAIGDNNLGTGYHRVVMGWYGTSAALSNGSTIMTLLFTYINGNTTLAWYDNGPSCEYADGNNNVLNDIPTSTYYINGNVCGNIPSPGTISGEQSVCLGEQGVSYSVSPVSNVTGYNWAVPPGASIINGNNTNSILVDYSLSASSGNIEVNGVNACGSGPLSTLPVTVNVLPVANAGNDVTIPYGTSTTLSAASGGTGSFSYHWSPESLLINPDLQVVQTVNLTTTTVFTLVVTNLSTLCQNSDEVVVYITGGPLSVHPIAIPDSICVAESAQLFANAGGGSGNYTYQWTCSPPGSPPWSSNLPNPIVSPDSSKTYNLTINDGFNTINGSTFLTVFQLPSATITGGDTLCGPGLTTTLTVSLTGIPPWFFIYSNGLTTNTVENVYTTPYLIVTPDPGTYTILTVKDLHCHGTTSGSAVVAVFPIPDTPVITESGIELISSSCCGNQWYQDGVLITGANSQIYHPSQTAHYTDIVTMNGCSSDTSNDIYFVMTGIGQHRSSRYYLEPNPARDYIVINSTFPIQDILRVQIFSTEGKEIWANRTNINAGANNLVCNIQDLSPGLYFLLISAKSGNTIYKLIIQK